jgi:hypothetical protein
MTGAEGEENAAEASDRPGAGGRLVPVTESIRYRRRAQAAEAKARELEAKFAQTQRELEQARKQVEAVERRQRIDQLLVESDAIDLEAARLLTEAAVSLMDEADVEAAVRELRRKKPYLFRQRGSVSGGPMSARSRQGARRDLGDAAETAAMSGDRRDLLRYLRMRRNRSN